MGLFGYLALLDGGLILVALKRKWTFLIGLSALATLIAELAWLDQFFNPSKTGAAVAVHLLFASLYVASEAGPRCRPVLFPDRVTAAGMPLFSLLGFGLVLVLLPRPEKQQLGLSLLFVFCLNVLVLGLAALSDRFVWAQLAMGTATFAWLLLWTIRDVTTETLFWALGAYLGFGLMQAVFPLILRARRALSPINAVWANAATLSMFVPILFLASGQVSFSWVIWTGLFGMGSIALWTALNLDVRWVAHGVLGLMLVAFAIYLGRLEGPRDVGSLILLLMLFTLNFLAASLVLERTQRAAEGRALRGHGAGESGGGFLTADLVRTPVLGVLMPFFLLVAAISRLEVHNPAPLFGLGFLLTILLLGLVYFLRTDEVCIVGLAAVLFLEWIWHLRRFDAESVLLSLPWYVVFAGVFMFFPFLFRQAMRTRRLPWFAAGFSAPLHFFLIYDSVAKAWGKTWIGLLPLLFALIGLGLLLWLLGIIPEGLPSRARWWPCSPVSRCSSSVSCSRSSSAGSG